MKRKRVISSLMILALTGTIKISMDASQYKLIKDKVNKYIAQQGLNEKEINMVNSDIVDISKIISNEHLDIPYNQNASEIVMAYKAKTIANMKSKGDSNLIDTKSQQEIDNAEHEAINSIKNAEYEEKNSIHKYKKFNIDKVTEDLGLSF